MNPFPISVDAHTALVEVFEVMRSKHLSHLPVVQGMKLVGIISKEDLLNAMLDLATESSGRNYNDIILRTTPVSKIMTTELITATVMDALDEAVDRMIDAKVHCIPVINEKDEPVGLLSPMDILRAYAAGIENIS